MLSDQYCGQVRDVVHAQLSDVTRGFNVQLGVTAAAAGVQPFEIDFSDTSRNFFEANINPEDIEGSTPFKYPLASLYIPGEGNTLDQAFITYSGVVRVVFTVYLSFNVSGIPRNVEKTTNAVSAAIVRTFCDSSAAASANFTGPVTYNRKIQIARSRLIMGAENWLLALTATLECGLDSF